MATYVKFVENNDWEGEEWTFWLQLDGNEDELTKLAEVIDGFDDEEDSFELDRDVELTDHDVSVLVEHGGSGYMQNHNKVVGVLAVPDDLTADGLYKGGIRDLFTAMDEKAVAS